ncbi:MAG: multidrug ABC transporter permease [Actinobacteria bacterium 13_2_20CM_2_72_6]|nr:MAG: multidrug ABC transporter permease [Actinobacteria bacterium 13_2_20CM_2_72_6]
MTALAMDTWWMTQRRLKALLRQPGVLAFTLIQPAIWLFLFGNLFKRIVELPGFGSPSYLTFLVPGVVVMSAVSAIMWAGMAALEEIDRGTLNRFLVTPVRRTAVMNANVLEQAVSTTIQSILIVALGLLGGARYPGGLPGMAVLVVTSALLGIVFSALSNTVGMLARQRESIIGLNLMMLLPLTFLSSAFMTRELMPAWMRHVAAANPLNWALDSTRAALGRDPDWAAVLIRGGWLLALAVVVVGLSVRTFRAYQKSV